MKKIFLGLVCFGICFFVFQGPVCAGDGSKLLYDTYNNNRAYDREMMREDQKVYNSLPQQQKEIVSYCRGLYYQTYNIMQPRMTKLKESCESAIIMNRLNTSMELAPDLTVEPMELQICVQNTFGNILRSDRNYFNKVIAATGATGPGRNFVIQLLNSWYYSPLSGPPFPSAVDILNSYH